MAREKGILEDWHDARGFGFIRRPAGGKLYVHMKSIGKSTERPKAGDTLSYEVGRGANGRPAATRRPQPGPAVRAAAYLAKIAFGMVMWTALFRSTISVIARSPATLVSM